IIDEAHMLSTAAFNALLKTLEEPPPRVTFIMAPTEVRKFPATIISRCQHYVFTMLNQQRLSEHLEKILGLEGIDYEPGAIQIIAKRGAGSVRDSMSLLGQALALSMGQLEEQTVREFLGLAGQDVFFSLMEGIQAGDVLAVGRVLREILDKGLDLGFFLRELTACWRNMFLLRQAGEGAVELLSMSADEAENWNHWAQAFPPAQIHASWQMTIEGQRRVMTSLEPALSLELLLLNLASLPDLLDLERISAGQMPGNVPGNAPGSAPRSGTPRSGPGPVSSTGGGQRMVPPQALAAPRPEPVVTPEPLPMPAPEVTPEPQSFASPQPPSMPEPPLPQSETSAQLSPVDDKKSMDDDLDDDLNDGLPEDLGSAAPSAPGGPLTAEGFKAYVADLNGSAGAVFNLNGLSLIMAGGELVVNCISQFDCRQFDGDARRHFDRLVRDYFGQGVSFRVEYDEGTKAKPEFQIREEAENHPAVQTVQAMFDARIQNVARRRE
ncbi:MAG: DNA polymerase III subunit gamma/tau, partial [Proteobacteria bacterium]|nr:DNA polymerase III subunit gamma/tau [Pseudomonadota bacterium]